MLVVMPCWSLAGRHGGIRVLCELASGLVRRGHRVVMLTFDGEGPTAFPTLAEHVAIGPTPVGKSLWRDLPRQERLRRAVERFPDADVVLASYHLTARPVHRARVKARKVYYVQAYEPDFYPRRLRHWPLVWLAKRSYRYPLALVANAPSIAQQVAPRLWKEVPIVPPGIDPAIYHARSRAAAGAPLRVGTIARTEDWKGTAECFEAVHRVRAGGRAVDFRVAFGNIPRGWENEPRTDESPRDDRALADWYRSLDVLLAGVWWGGAPYPPIEAMACGAAVVSTPNDHVAEGRNALTAPQQDPVALAAALERMLADEELRARLVAQGLEDARRHEWGHVVESMERILSGERAAPRGDRA